LNDFLEIMERTVESAYSNSLSKPLVLVADDEPSILQYIEHVLRLANYRVITVTTVEEAWKIFERQQPEIELVLTDIVMPVLFITGALSESDPRTALMVEEQQVLRKPFFPQQLVDFVGAQLDKQSPSGLAR
jgi:DNA-binding response OmpR family regulator